MSHVSTSHVTYINESCHKHEWVTSRRFINWLLPTSASRTELAISFTNRMPVEQLQSLATPDIGIANRACNMNKSRHTYQWVRSNTWMSHVTQVHKLATPDTRIANRACDFFHESHARRAIAKSAAPQRWTACNSTSFGCVTYGCFPYAFLHELYISTRTACPSSKCKVYCSSVINSLQFYTIWVSHMHSFTNCIFCHEPHARKAIHGEE